MKKILSLTLLLMMSLAVFTFLPARAEDDTNVSAQTTSFEDVSTDDDADSDIDNLERILSPDQLKYFKVIRRENGALYGVRLHANTMTATAYQDDDNAENDDSKLEKIPSPDQLKYFKVMKKENGALYGIRLKANTAGNANAENSNVSLDNKDQSLEKILAPQFISLYEKIKKIGNSLWGVKKSETVNGDSQVKAQRLVTADMVKCVSAAIDSKDEAMINLTKNSAEKITTAISARGTCQKEAIASTNNQAQNLKECVLVFQKTHKEIVTEARKEQKDIWNNYKTDMKACAASSLVVDAEIELMIDDGGSNTLESVLED